MLNYVEYHVLEASPGRGPDSGSAANPFLVNHSAGQWPEAVVELRLLVVSH